MEAAAQRPDVRMSALDARFLYLERKELPLASASRFVSRFPLYNFLCTNVPGLPTVSYVCCQRRLASYPHVSTGYEAGVSLTVESHNAGLHFGLSFDPQAAPGGERMNELLDISLADLARRARLPLKPWKARNRDAA
jgi:hypothetical protein